MLFQNGATIPNDSAVGSSDNIAISDDNAAVLDDSAIYTLTLNRRYISIALKMYIERIYIALFFWSLLLWTSLAKTWTQVAEPPLDSGKIRIRWTCQCGTKQWNDFVELRPNAAEDLRKSLDYDEMSSVRRPQGWTNDVQGRTTSQNTSAACLPGGDLGGSNIATANGTSSASTPPSFQGAAPTAGIIAPRGRRSAEIDSSERKFLPLCFSKMNDTLRLSQPNIEHIKNDFQLFRMLQDEYAARKGSVARFLAIRKITSVKFRKVSAHRFGRT